MLCDQLLGYYDWRDPRMLRCDRPAHARGACLGSVRPGPLPWPLWRSLTIWFDGSHLTDPAWLEAEALALRTSRTAPGQ
jgi:hypothetical protein